ncbi:MAG TPA: DUF5063 domain-containing protein [Bacteroidales bacterium]|jgi:hypothetical protein|nr:DUF5063 domain-containing protein [Bacteroidales bacterium]MDD4236172.1 DUF5063 domain-containing protein [Bacteroidales bacterium]MDY0159957.1 DUF5063 domain-containing protein [Bacteroidales bacterium]HXK82237.1 DUF5063 domain-containing protein [Bacteroidales bacterium]
MVDKSVIYSKNTIEFITVAKEFLSFCETKKIVSKQSFADTSLKLISLLYLKALTIPETELQESENIEKYVTEEAWAFVKNNVENNLGAWDDIIEFKDSAMMNSTDYIHVSLSELYADIYQDVGDLIGSYQMGDELNMYDALHICHQNFKNYWGYRVIKIIEVLHYKVFFAKQEDED